MIVRKQDRRCFKRFKFHETKTFPINISVQSLYPLQATQGQTWNQSKTVEVDTQHETSVSCGGSDSTKSHSPELKAEKKPVKRDEVFEDLPKIVVPQPEFDWMKIKRAPPKTCK